MNAFQAMQTGRKVMDFLGKNEGDFAAGGGKIKLLVGLLGGGERCYELLIHKTPTACSVTIEG